MTDIAHLILEELVYEKVCVGASIADLVLFEEDLDRSIIRALDDTTDEPAARDRLFARHLETAWKRWMEQQARQSREAEATNSEPFSSSSTKASSSSWLFGSCPNAWQPLPPASTD